MAAHEPLLRGVEPSAPEARGDTEGFLLHRWRPGLQLVHSSRWPLHAAAISNSCKESLIYGCSYEHFFGSSVTFLIWALQDTEETDCSSFHKKLRDVSLERQRALYSNAHTHTSCCSSPKHREGFWGCQPGCRISVGKQKYYHSHHWASPCTQSDFDMWISDNICYFYSFS